MSIDKTLKERGDRYGAWTGNAEKAQVLKDVLRDFEEWKLLDDIHKEALDMIMVKVGRILNGDPNYIDNWHDIIGFARLVEKELEKPVEVQKPTFNELSQGEPVPLVVYEDYAPATPYATKL